ncbi:hypothetical protein GO730_09040 [Spirosoma sp. HMF3257]|uniref:Uncharacterized protein n=1 Tax=Spirosoma telluris TaxID=2183553 RepID=A0A327NNZ6_9BACT|nr:hypothetical protein [Spirosoma telluris]RAI74388.1 hypothetical protein HMF3257_08955 [Spirosoma telluris]
MPKGLLCLPAQGRLRELKVIENSIKSALKRFTDLLGKKNKKAAPKIGAAFRFYPHHFKIDDRAAAGS